MANEYFQPGSVPAPNSPGSSAVMRNEFASISGGFDKLPVLAGHAGEIVTVNPTGTALVTSGAVIGDYVTKDGVFVLTNKTIAWASNTFPGFGTGATKNAGTLAGNVLLLTENNKLPLLDGSLLTGLNFSSIGGVLAISQGGTGANTLGGAQQNLGIDLKANQHNATLTGAPTAPTPATGDSSARIATTYFVTNTLADIGSFAPSNATPLMDGVATQGTGALGSRDDHVHPTDDSRAPLASPALTGNPTAPTPVTGDNDISIATTAFVNAEIAADRPYSNTNPLMDGVAAQGSSPNISRQDHVHPTDITRAPLASPALTGTPTAPTPSNQDTSTRLATTAFVQSVIASQPAAGMQPSNSTPLMNGTATPGVGVEGSRHDHVHPRDSSKAALTGADFTGRVSGSAQGNPAAALIARKDTIPSFSLMSAVAVTGEAVNTHQWRFGMYYEPSSQWAGPSIDFYRGADVADGKMVINGVGIELSACPTTNAAQNVASNALTRKDYVDNADSQLLTAINGKQNALGFTPVNRAGDTMTGQLSLSSTDSGRPFRTTNSNAANAVQLIVDHRISDVVLGNARTGGKLVINNGQAESVFNVKRNNDTGKSAYLGYVNQAGTLDAYIGYGDVNYNFALVNQRSGGAIDISANSDISLLSGSSITRFFGGATQNFTMYEGVLLGRDSAYATYANGFYLSPGTLNLGVPTGTGFGFGFVLFGYNGGAAGAITLNSATSVGYNTTSDYRMKDDPQPLTGSGDFIDALQPKTWSWKNGGAKGIGFIAHEVQEVSPNSVVGEKDAVDEDGNPKMQMMEYGSAEFIANIVAELQALRRRVAELEAK